MAIYSLAERPAECVSVLLGIWEASVRATHHFLSEEDIRSIKPLVEIGLREIPSLSVITDAEDAPLGFMGVNGDKIEMLFISPQARGRGLGKQMIGHALRQFGADRLDVNEQNTQGVSFYIHMGFEVVGRSPLDGQGKPFPLLGMTLRREAHDVPAGYSIRHAEDAHIPFLNGIELAAATLFPSGFIPEQVLRERVPLAVLRAAADLARLWVALKDGEAEPVGYALLQVHDGAGLLAQLDVRPEHGRKGLGAALTSRVIRAARGMGLPELYLTTFAGIAWNAPFYAKLGFIPVEAREQPRFIRQALREEEARGLRQRVAMKFPLGEAAIRPIRPEQTDKRTPAKHGL